MISQQMRSADGVKIAVLRKGRTNLEFILAAAHAHDSKSTNLTRITASNLKAIEEVNVTGIEKSDY
jgi:hypothetical protein